MGSRLDNGYHRGNEDAERGPKIMHLPELKVCCTCVRVPVMRSHSISLAFVTRDPISEQAAQAVAPAPGCRYISDLDPLYGRNYPTPLDTTDQDLVYVGRIRRDLIHDNGLCLWCCGDQIRKGAATNAVQIAELLARGQA
ncbi:MAG: Asd/ArgC dimerization domain-containing protein [Christensenellales bacterium]